MAATQHIRKQLQTILNNSRAHIGFEEALSDFPLKGINKKLPDGSYSAWHLLEHIRIAQWDILEYVRNPNHISPEWPGGYWPRATETASADQWKDTVERIMRDLREMDMLIGDPKADLLGPLPHVKDRTLFEEALILADHNAYHLGELIIFKRLNSKAS